MKKKKEDIKQMTRESRLPPGGTNLFQEIKAVCAEAEKSGQTLYRLSIGQPSGPALLPAREVAANAVMSDAEQMHEYQDNGSPGVPGFAERFINVHVDFNVYDTQLKCLPTPGIKPMLGLVILACGGRRPIKVLTSPGYPTPDYWAKDCLSCHTWQFNLSPENKFRFDIDQLGSNTELLMTNYPHNPSGQVASREWWFKICGYAQAHNIRIFNDAAYSILAHTDEHCTLSDVAVDFPDLSWAEAFSASKAGNFCGWRIAAMVGSPDFIGDIAKIKGNTDSGIPAPLAAGVLATFEKHLDLIEDVRQTYERRMQLLISTLINRRMRLAVAPGAGFFTLWQTPTYAFDQKITSAKQFNELMIKESGVVGVHFEPFIRYAVCGDVEAMIEHIDVAFARAMVSYEP